VGVAAVVAVGSETVLPVEEAIGRTAVLTEEEATHSIPALQIMDRAKILMEEGGRMGVEVEVTVAVAAMVVITSNHRTLREHPTLLMARRRPSSTVATEVLLPVVHRRIMADMDQQMFLRPAAHPLLTVVMAVGGMPQEAILVMVVTAQIHMVIIMLLPLIKVVTEEDRLTILRCEEEGEAGS